MKKYVGLWVLLLGTTLLGQAQVDTSYIYNTNMPYGTLDLRIAKSSTRYYYLQEDITFSFRESAPGVKTNTYQSMVTWNTSAYGEGNLREVNGTSDTFVMNYRLLKPKNYNESYAEGYPIIMMIHGAGESGNCWLDTRCAWATANYNPVTNSPPAPTTENHRLLNNDRNLLHGGAQHLNAVNRAGSMLPDDPNLPVDAFPGFVLFPQSLNGWMNPRTVEDAIRLLRLVIKKYNIDESRVYIHGLSNGGIGTYQAIKRAPWLFAAALPMSSPTDAGISTHGIVPEVSKIPLWIFQGGQDNNPPPQRTYNYVRTFRNAGANVRYYLYPHLGHGTWNTAYKEPDFFSWIREQRKYNPHIYYGHPYICNPTQTGVRMAFSEGFFAYQWERDGQIIAGETGPEFTANTPGTYRGRFSRKPNPSEADWERWSDPVVVSELDPEKPTVQLIGTAHLRGPGLASTDLNNTAQLRAAESAEFYEWYKDGTLVNFPGTDVDDTLRVATFVNGSSAGNGAYTLVAKNYNCPTPPSDPINIFFNNSSPQSIELNAQAMAVSATVSSSSIFLSWNDVSGVESGYEIWRRAAGTPDFMFVTRTPQDAVSFHDTKLNPGTTYEYKLRAVNNSARSNYVPSDDLSVNYAFTTSGDYRFPPPPQNLTVVTNTLNTITLSWEPAEDESSIKEYYVYYNGDSISTGGSETSFTLTGLSPNSVYTVSVRALDYGNHLSQPSNQLNATTYLFGLTYKHSTGAWESLDDSAMVATWNSPEFTGTVPNFTLEPRTQHDFFNFQFSGYLNIETEGTYFFDITSDDGSRLYINGNVIADNDGLHGRKTVVSEGVYLTTGPQPIMVEYFDDTGGHFLQVRYKGPGVGDGVNFVVIPDAALRSGNYVPPTPPAPPTGLTATSGGMQEVSLSWQFADDAATDYEVYRSTSDKGPYTIVVRAKGTSATDSIGLIPGTQYYYKVKTVNNNGSSDFSSTVSVSTDGDTSPPTAPQNLALMSKTLTNAALTWDASTDNVDVVKYEIFDGTKLVGTSTVQAFTVQNLLPNTQYIFTVKAVDASENRSAASNDLVVVTNTSAVFYSSASGSLNSLSTWGRNMDGTGEHPANFSDNGQYFVITNRSNVSLDGAWTVEGSASRVIVPEGVTLNVDQAFTANVELQGNAVLNLNHSTGPKLARLSPASTVNFNAVGTIPALTYGNVILSGAVAKTFAADTSVVLGNMTVHEGLSLKGASQNRSHIRLSGNLTLQGSRPETAADNAIGLAFTGATAQTLSTESDVHLFQIAILSASGVSVSHPSGQAVSLYLGSLNGGGLLLANGSVLNKADHNLILDDAAIINPGQQTGAIATYGGDLTVSSTASQNSFVYFHNDDNRIQRLTLNISGAGIFTVRAPLQIIEGIKINDGTLAAEREVVLLATENGAATIYEIEKDGRITGDVTVQKHLPAAGRVFHYLSAPVSPVTVSEWQQSFPITGSFSGSSTGEGLDNAPSLFSYREGTGWVAYPQPGGSNSATIDRGVGYAALLRNGMNPVTLTSTGTPYQGTVSFNVEGTASDPSGNGWNLLGNPYASPIRWTDADGAWTTSGISNVIAIRRDTTVNGQRRSQVTYHDLRLGGGVIPAGDAFWVRTFTASPSLAIGEKAKVDPDEDTPQPGGGRYLVVGLKQGELIDPAYIIFSDDAGDGFDPELEGRKLSNYGMFNLSTIAEDTVLLAINHVTDNFCSKTINLNVADVDPGSYQLTFTNIESLPDIGEMALNDHFTGATFNVDGGAYAFAVTTDPASYGATRFSITFTRRQVDVSSPVVEADDVCAPGPGYIGITNSQVGVMYQVTRADGTAISDLVAGSGERIDIQLHDDALQPGANTVKVTAGFEGCERKAFPREFTIQYVTELTVETEGDVSVCEGSSVTLEASGAPVGGYYQWFDSNGTLIEGATTNTFTVAEVLIESVYYVSVGHPNGCESDKEAIHIYADTLDMPVVLMKDDTLFTEAAGYYQWKKDGEEIPGATLHYYVPTEEGDYSVIASNGGCHKESEPFQIGEEPPVTGIDNGNNPEFSLSIYPVPSEGHSINVLMRSPKTDPVLIEIVDAMGRLHFSSTIDAATLTRGTNIVPSAPLNTGMYFLRATQSDIKARKKLIVKE